MAHRPAIPRRLEKALFQEVGSKCPFCGQDDINVLEIHHIMKFAQVRKHHPGNMIVLCATCHERAQCGQIPPDELFELKRRLREAPPDRKAGGRKRAGSATRVSGVLAAGRDIKAGRDIIVRVAGQKRASRVAFVPGTVAEDKWKVGYLKYLGHRFNKFKEWEMKQKGEKMRYALVWVSYRQKMRFNVEQTPLELFDRAVEYLKGRVDATMLGRIRAGQGRPGYRDFDEYVELGADEVQLPT